MHPSRFSASRRQLLRAGTLTPAGLTLACLGVSAAEPFPSRTIRIIVPFTPGGGTDVVGRTLLVGMQAALGQALIIDNKPGAGTVIGTDIVAKAPADGYTLLMTTSAIAINDSLVKKLPYDTQKDITEVALICTGPNVLVTRAGSPYQSVADVIAAAKAAPGKLTYASSGNGSAVHLAGELFKNMARVDIAHVPYRGAGPAYNDLIGGQVDLLFGTAGGVAKLVAGGKMLPIGITSARRSAAYKDVPTIAETLPGYEADVWYALFAPAGTPPAVIATLNAALRKAAETPAYRDRLANEGLTVAAGTPEQMTRLMRAEEARWRKVVVDGKVTID
ncbi:tripartite tricarboxylate transporter substrate binding protein [Variovorax paradoxus]|uniref:Tripartite tricarboxylate transporter family receptor n=1 Tax=Variovorax paradoxus TaxID=34073 RepID=A0A0H2M1Y1_VARPD|nr:tripartite tricarboxylate transporter substrate binding protein [Variovorax paradoxus]KLN56414.1 tripartite tricarboxylate transporter family receptor [Variovorax paradoxus]